MMLYLISCQQIEMTNSSDIIVYLKSKGYLAKKVDDTRITILNSGSDNFQRLKMAIKEYYVAKGYIVTDVSEGKSRMENNRTENIDSCTSMGIQNYPASGVICELFICFTLGGSTSYLTTCTSYKF